MKLAYAMLADSAQFTPDGRLWVLGGDIDTLYVPAIPAKQPLLTLVFKVLFAPEECEREHTLRVDVTSPDGTLVKSGESLSFVPHVSPDRPDEDVGVGVPVLIQNQEFQTLGQYVYHILVDDQELAELPLRISPVPAQMPLAHKLDMRPSKQHEETKA